MFIEIYHKKLQFHFANSCQSAEGKASRQANLRQDEAGRSKNLSQNRMRMRMGMGMRMPLQPFGYSGNV